MASRALSAGPPMHAWTRGGVRAGNGNGCGLARRVHARPLIRMHAHPTPRRGPQVETLCAVVEKAEALVASAEQAASALQASYHHDAFRAYPHVNSPAWLIKQLSQQPEMARV